LLSRLVAHGWFFQVPRNVCATKRLRRVKRDSKRCDDGKATKQFGNYKDPALFCKENELPFL
jgi:hypothetical protein